jgi:ribosomal protein S18 acetylase RimI-like enzyme
VAAPETPLGGEVGIGRALREDFEAVAALWTEAYVELGDGSRTVPYRSEEAEDSDRDGALFVARHGSQIVGAVALYLPGDAGGAVRKDDEAEISRLAVATSARRWGIARGLMAYCHELAAASPAKAIALWSRPTQVEAHRLYESLGYRRVPAHESGGSSGEGRVVYRLSPGQR